MVKYEFIIIKTKNFKTNQTKMSVIVWIIRELLGEIPGIFDPSLNVPSTLEEGSDSNKAGTKQTKQGKQPIKDF